MIVACAADSKQGWFDKLERRVKDEGIEFIFGHLPKFSWAGLIEWELEVAQRHPNSHIVFVDAWDFIMQGSRADLARVLSQQSVLFHSDAHCWPEPHKADKYPTASTRYRYVNGTGPAGWGECLIDLLEYGMREFPIRGRESSIFADNDQRFWTDVYLNWPGITFPLRIDTSCELSFPFNCSTRSDFDIVGGRLYTVPMGSFPVFLHMNGASKFAPPEGLA